MLYMVLVWGGRIGMAQDLHRIDSLKSALESVQAIKKELGKYSPKPNDTTEVNILYDISTAYWGNQPDLAIDYANQCLDLSRVLSYKKGVAKAYNSLGVTAWYQGEYAKSLAYLKRSLKLWLDLGDEKGIASSYGNIGMVLDNQGNYNEALRHYYLALKLQEKLGNKQFIAGQWHNIAGIYSTLGDYSKALNTFKAALKINVELGNKNRQGLNLEGIGTSYARIGNFLEALKYHRHALALRRQIDDQGGIASSLLNIGGIYSHLNQDTALHYFFDALSIHKSLDQEADAANIQFCIAECYIKLRKFPEADHYLKLGYSSAKEMGSLGLMMDYYNLLSQFQLKMGNFKQSLESYKRYVTYRDSLVNIDHTKKAVAMQLNFEFDRKQDSLNTAQSRKDLLAKNEKNRQQMIRNTFIGGFSLMVCFAVVFFRQRNRIAKGKRKSDELLLNILPEEVAEELKRNGNTKAKLFDAVTVMFTDFKDFTSLGENMNPEELVHELDTCFSAFDTIIQKYGIEKIKTIGDAYMCAGGIPVSDPLHAENMVRAALEIRDFMRNHNRENSNQGKPAFEIRIGINSGSVVAGIVGLRKFAYDIWGDTVNLASRIESHGEAGKVNISGNTFKLIQAKFKCIHRGKIHTKGKGEVDMYFVEDDVNEG